MDIHNKLIWVAIVKIIIIDFFFLKAQNEQIMKNKRLFKLSLKKKMLK
jgi:hypothetical protein